tara:strand:+ start:1439 stop:1813 length:375 start_codon:yes stop_codon:yes gene_type:complete
MRLVKHRQGGWSFLSLLVFLLVAGVFVSIGFKLVPVYTDHETLKSILLSTQNDRALMAKTKNEIELSLTKKLRINNMKLPEKFLKITKDKGDVFLDIDYEIRIPIFMNVDAVVSFKEQYIGRER